MWVWIFMLVSIVAVYFLIPDAIGKKKKNLIFLAISFCIMVFVVGSRSAFLTESTDLHNYYVCYGRALSWSLEEMLEHYTMEDGYIILNKVLAAIVPWNYFIVYFEAAFCTFVMFWYIYRNADSVFLAVIIYICLGPWQFFLTGFRQAIAICICFVAYELLKGRSLKKDAIAFVLIMLATTMHSTAIIFLLAYLIRKIKITKKLIIYSAVFTFIMLFFLDDILAFGSEILGKTYTQSYYGNEFGGLVPIVIYLGTLMLNYLIWSSREEYFEEGDNAFDIAMLIVGLCIYTLRYNSLIMERASFYFTSVVTVVLANSITRQRTKLVRNMTLAVCVAVCIGLFIYRAVAQYGEYHFYWEYLERITIV